MSNQIDCRRLECPAPVLKTREFIQTNHPDSINVIVDNDAAVENVSRFLDSQGYLVSVDSDGQISKVCGTKSANDEAASSPMPSNSENDHDHQAVKIMVMISSRELGKGDSKLGRKLMINYLKTLKEMGEDLWRLVFVNDGVKFSIKDSPILGELKVLENSGTFILVCGACLTHFELLDDKVIGQTTNMLDIVTSMQLADKIINL